MWIKWYLLWWSDEFMPIGGMLTGAPVGAALTLILVDTDVAVLRVPVWFYTLVTSLLGAFIFQFIKWKYISRAEDTSATALLRQVHTGKVIASKAMFTKNCRPVALPVIKDGKTVVELEITRQKQGKAVHFFSKVSVYFGLNEKELLLGFDAERLFRIVQQQRSQSIYQWLHGRLLDVQESEFTGAMEVGDTPEQFAQLATRHLWRANYEVAIARLGNVKAVDVNVRYEIEQDEGR